jgi:hypothetical protein
MDAAAAFLEALEQQQAAGQVDTRSAVSARASERRQPP